MGINLSITTLETKSFAKVSRFLRAGQGNVYEADFWIEQNRTPGKNYKSGRPPSRASGNCGWYAKAGFSPASGPTARRTSSR